MYKLKRFHLSTHISTQVPKTSFQTGPSLEMSHVVTGQMACRWHDQKGHLKYVKTDMSIWLYSVNSHQTLSHIEPAYAELFIFERRNIPLCFGQQWSYVVIEPLSTQISSMETAYVRFLERSTDHLIILLDHSIRYTERILKWFPFLIANFINTEMKML